MRRILITATLLALVAGCGGSNEKKAAEPGGESAATAGEEDNAEIVNPRKVFDRNAAHPELPPSAKIGGVEGRSPFEGDRVIGLNAIVRRSFDTSKLYDRNIDGIRAQVAKAAATNDPDEKALAEEGLKKVEGWYAEAKAAFDDMAKAEEDLRASGEFFDEGIFGAMVKFVKDIEKELREEQATLSAKLG